MRWFTSLIGHVFELLYVADTAHLNLNQLHFQCITALHDPRPSDWAVWVSQALSVLFVWVGGVLPWHAVQQPKDNFQESVLCFHHVGPGSGIQVMVLGSKSGYPLNHLASPHGLFKATGWAWF